MPNTRVFSLNVQGALAGLKRADALMGLKVDMGMEKAGTRLMLDTLTGLPTTPIRRGNPPYPPTDMRLPGELRASGAVFVNGHKRANSVAYGEGATGKYQPNEYGGLPIRPMSHEACVVFNAPYAATQHNQFPNKTEPTAGMEFLSVKLYGNAPVYIAIIAQAARL